MSKIMVKYHLFPKVVEKLQAIMKDEVSSPRKFAPKLQMTQIHLDKAISSMDDSSEFPYTIFNTLR